MANLEKTNYSPQSLIVDRPIFKGDTINSEEMAAFEPGTILARVTSTGNLEKYTRGNSDGTQIPVAVLTYSLAVEESTDMHVRVLINGLVLREDLIVHGEDSPEITEAEADALRSYGIIAMASLNSAEYDNA